MPGSSSHGRLSTTQSIQLHILSQTIAERALLASCPPCNLLETSPEARCFSDLLIRPRRARCRGASLSSHAIGPKPRVMQCWAIVQCWAPQRLQKVQTGAFPTAQTERPQLSLIIAFGECYIGSRPELIQMRQRFDQTKFRCLLNNQASLLSRANLRQWQVRPHLQLNFAMR